MKSTRRSRSGWRGYDTCRNSCSQQAKRQNAAAGWHHLTILFLKHSDGAHWRAASPAYLERQTDEAKTPPAYELVHIDQIFIMRKAHLPANMMHFLIRNATHSRRHGFNAECRDFLLALPARGCNTDSRAIVPIFCPKRAAIMIGIEQNRVSRFHLMTGPGKCVLQISGLDQLQQIFV